MISAHFCRSSLLAGSCPGVETISRHHLGKLSSIEPGTETGSGQGSIGEVGNITDYSQVQPSPSISSILLLD